MADYGYRKAFRKGLKAILEPEYQHVVDFKDSKIEPVKDEFTAVIYIDTGQFEHGHNLTDDQFMVVVELWTDSRENPADDLDDAAAKLMEITALNQGIAGCDWLPADYEYIYDPDSFIAVYEQRFIVTYQQEL